jgi:hypothetical protein
MYHKSAGMMHKAITGLKIPLKFLKTLHSHCSYVLILVSGIGFLKGDIAFLYHNFKLQRPKNYNISLHTHRNKGLMYLFCGLLWADI